MEISTIKSGILTFTVALRKGYSHTQLSTQAKYTAQLRRCKYISFARISHINSCKKVRLWLYRAYGCCLHQFLCSDLGNPTFTGFWGKPGMESILLDLAGVDFVELSISLGEIVFLNRVKRKCPLNYSDCPAYPYSLHKTFSVGISDNAHHSKCHQTVPWFHSQDHCHQW